jgi:hypothetical protein
MNALLVVGKRRRLQSYSSNLARLAYLSSRELIAIPQSSKILVDYCEGLESLCYSSDLVEGREVT